MDQRHFHIWYPQQVYNGDGTADIRHVQDPKAYKHQTQAYRVRKHLAAEIGLPLGLVTVRANCPGDCLGARSHA